MGAGYQFQCSSCDFKAETSGPWEFYRDKEGRRLDYGHPCPVSEAARSAGIAGLYADMFCLDCGEASEHILVEYIRPASSLQVWTFAAEPKPSSEHPPPRCAWR